MLLAGLAQKPLTGEIPLDADEHRHCPTTRGDTSPSADTAVARGQELGTVSQANTLDQAPASLQEIFAVSVA